MLKNLLRRITRLVRLVSDSHLTLFWPGLRTNRNLCVSWQLQPNALIENPLVRITGG